MEKSQKREIFFNLANFEDHMVCLMCCLFYFDEVPTEPREVWVFGIIRDAIKILESVVVVVAGTNSNAANIIGVGSEDAASSSDVNSSDSPWSFYVTRLPKFVIVPNSATAVAWNEIVAQSTSGTSLDEVKEVIESSIQTQANPRLIVDAIQSLKRTLNTSQKTFGAWQAEFSERVVKKKFTYKSFSKTKEALNAQLNLLLEASCNAQYSDAVVPHHFGYRARPFTKPGTSIGCVLNDCGGWLLLCGDRDKSLGRKLYFATNLQADSSRDYDWQTSIFAKVHEDPLLYLCACRKEGFFTSHIKESSQSDTRHQIYLAHEVVSAFWVDHAFGRVNFKNVLSPHNGGCRLEVLTLAAVCNAAAKCREERVDLCVLVSTIATELGIADASNPAITQLMSADSAFSGLSLPRYIFPDSLNQLRFPGMGFVRRVTDSEKFDIEVGPVGGGSGRPQRRLRIEAKDRDSMTIPQIVLVSTKVILEENDVGILVLRKCSGLWSGDAQYTANLNKLTTQLSKENMVGRVYVVSADRRIEEIKILEGMQGRLFIIQVPESSL